MLYVTLTHFTLKNLNALLGISVRKSYHKSLYIDSRRLTYTTTTPSCTNYAELSYFQNQN
jgi:hypothetical protein